jgi:hypothetical protein
MSSVRAAQHRDFETFVDILAKSFRHESYVSTFLHPQPDAQVYPEQQYDEDLKRYWRHHLRPRLYDPQYHCLKVCRDGGDGEVIGVAVWRQAALEDGVLGKMNRCELYVSIFYIV